MANESSSKKEAEAEVASTDKLSKDIETLKADLSQIAGTLRDLGLQTKDTAVEEGRRRYELARLRGNQQVDHLRHSAEDFSHQATEAVRDRPGTALLIAAGIGMIFGILTARK